jgi:hypothetical protein
MIQVLNNRTVMLVGRLLMLLALALSAGACGEQSPVTGSAGGETSAPADSSYDTPDPGAPGNEGGEGGEPPATEGAGPEKPPPPQTEHTSIQLPSLPIGTNDNTPDTINEPHCVKLSWSGVGEIPSDFSVVVTEVRLNSSAYFRKGTKGCRAPSCESYTFRSSSESCIATVIPLVYDQDDGDQDMDLSLSLVGRVDCPAEKRQECQKFVDEQAGQETHVRIFAPSPPSTEDTPLPTPEPEQSPSAVPEQSPPVGADQPSVSET